MADKLLGILTEIEAILTAETASGQALDDIRSFFVLRTAADVPPEYGSQTPVLIVRCQGVTGEVVSIPACVTTKAASIVFSLYTDNGGNTTDPTAAGILDALEDVFNQDDLGYAYFVGALQKTYQQTSFPPFSGNWLGAGEMTIIYQYTDIRSV